MTPQNGNILFTILIAIALFALLGSVIMSGDSANNKLTDEKARLYAQDIVDYAQAVENAVQTMLNNGISENLLCFDFDEYPGGDDNYEHTACNTAANRVFHGNGGGVRYREAPADYFDTANSGDARTGKYIFAGTTDVINLPRGTDESGESELIMFVFGLKKDICIQINNIVNWGVKYADPLVEPASASPTFANIHYKGAFSKDNQIGDTSDPNADDFSGLVKGCFATPSSGNYPDAYIAYFVLHVR